MLPERIKFDSTEDIQYINSVISEVTNDYNFEFYNRDDQFNLLKRLTKEGLRRIAQNFFTDGGNYYKYLTQFSVSHGFNHVDFLKWISGRSDIDIYLDILIQNSIIRLIIYKELFPIFNTIDSIDMTDAYFERKNSIHTIICIDGDNLETAVIPYYRGIIKNDNIIISSYYINNLVPNYIKYLQEFYYNPNIYTILSYDDKKDASDIELQYVFNTIMTDAIINDLSKVSCIITNDGYKFETKSLFDKLNMIKSAPNTSLKRTINIIDPFELSDVWKFIPNYNTDNGHYIKSIVKNNDNNISYSTSFIKILKSINDIAIADNYKNIYNLVKSNGSFMDILLFLNNNIRLSIYDKYNYFSQYCVLTSSKYLSYYELKYLLEPYYIFIKKQKEIFSAKNKIKSNNIINNSNMIKIDNIHNFKYHTLYNPIYTSDIEKEKDNLNKVLMQDKLLNRFKLLDVGESKSNIYYLFHLFNVISVENLFLLLKEDLVIALDIKGIQYIIKENNEIDINYIILGDK